MIDRRYNIFQFQSNSKRLDNPGNNFEKGKHDSFEVTCPELGSVGANRFHR